MKDSDGIILSSVIKVSSYVRFNQVYVCYTDKNKSSVMVFVILNFAFKKIMIYFVFPGTDPNPESLIYYLKPILKAPRSPAILRACLPILYSFSPIDLGLKGLFENCQ